MRTRAILSGVIVLMISFVNGDKIDWPIPCTNETDCRSMQALPSDAFCEDGHCMCPNSDSGSKYCSSVNASLHHYVLRNGPLVYRTCKHDQDCAFLQGFCNTTNSQCECEKGYVSSSNQQRCVEVIQSINASCMDKNQCIAFLANTACENKTCVCKSGYRYENNTCLKLTEYGQPCTKHEECLYIDGVICVNNTVCECWPGTVLSASGEKCLPVVKNILGNCTESVQCVTRFQHSNCTDSTCRCNPGYHYANDPDQCILTKGIDENCTNTYECYQVEDDTKDPPSKSLTCMANKCTCAGESYWQENQCVNKSSSIAASFPVFFVFLIALTCGSLFS